MVYVARLISEAIQNRVLIGDTSDEVRASTFFFLHT